LAALLHGILVVGVSQTLRRWTEGATHIRQGGHHVGHWPKFLVSICYGFRVMTSWWVMRIAPPAVNHGFLWTRCQDRAGRAGNNRTAWCRETEQTHKIMYRLLVFLVVHIQLNFRLHTFIVFYVVIVLNYLDFSCKFSRDFCWLAWVWLQSACYGRPME